MIFNIALHLIVIILYLLFAKHTRANTTKHNNIFLVVVFFLFFILVAFRDESMGNDTASYLELYSRCAQKKWDMDLLGGYYDSGFLIFNIVLSYISPSRRFFMIIMSLIFNFSVYRFIKRNSNNYFLSVLLYIGLMFFYSSMTMMRQFMAMSLALESIEFVKQKRVAPFICLMLLALTMHSTAILAFLIYPIFNMKFKKNRAVLIIIGSALSTLFIGSIYTAIMGMLGRDTYYLSRIGHSSNFSSIINFVIYFIFAWFIARTARKEGKETQLSPYANSSTAAASLSIMSLKMNILSRADDYFSLTLIAGLPNTIELLRAEKNKRIAKIAIIIFSIAFSSTIIILRPEWNTAYNYIPCFSNKSTSSCFSP